MEKSVNPCEKCCHKGYVKCRECHGRTLFGKAGHCDWCDDSGVEDCPYCHNPKEFRG